MPDRTDVELIADALRFYAERVHWAEHDPERERFLMLEADYAERALAAEEMRQAEPKHQAAHRRT